MTFKTRYTQTFAALALTYLIFMATRLALLLIYPNDFASLSTMETILSLLYGLRVDTAIIFTFTGLLFLILTLPLKVIHNRSFRMAMGALWGAIVAFITVFNVGDILYFGFVHRHVMNELQVIGNDINILTEMALNFYLPHTLAGIAGVVITVALFARLFHAPIRDHTCNSRTWYSVPLILVVLFLGIRGKVTGISFGISDAFAVNKLASGNLALNGFFCIYRSGQSQHVKHNHMPLKEALENVKTLLDSPNTTYVNSDYPMLRRYLHDTTPKPYNVVIIMLESWSARYIDSFTGNGYGATPYFDSLAEAGVRFTNFYANGQRSLEGITSLFTGISTPFGFKNFGEGLELSGLSYLGKIAQENGYHTLSMQSANRGSFRVDKLSELAGFKEYYGAEDIPHVGQEKGKPYYGVWDGDMLAFLLEKLNNAPQPFMSYSFTASTHAPYFSPGKQWEIHPHDDTSRKGYLNTLYYTDKMLERFMESAKKMPWFENTIFIFTADHCLGYDVRGEQLKQDAAMLKGNEARMLPRNHIPLLIYAPSLFQPSTNPAVGSHNDIMATLSHTLGWETPFASISQSLFDTEAKQRFAVTRQGNVIAMTDGNASVTYNFKDFMELRGDPEHIEKLKRQLLSIDTVQATLLEQTKWEQRQ